MDTQEAGRCAQEDGEAALAASPDGKKWVLRSVHAEGAVYVKRVCSTGGVDLTRNKEEARIFTGEGAVMNRQKICREVGVFFVVVEA